MTLHTIPQVFYTDDPSVVAQKLLGALLVREFRNETLIGRIVETEAYLADGDEASHGFKGLNSRNASMFKEAGHAYVHQMRQWNLLDVVVQGAGVPAGVLIRAVEPVQGVATMSRLRGPGVQRGLANGPGKLCQAFAINRELDGISVTDPSSPLRLAFSEETSATHRIQSSGRIGITKAKDELLRFFIVGNPHVSR
ncbi:MAG: DNA-3-methyladenine glycosylase [Candidatus Pacebacteria bacterium]|nr:DNA-3-methyladenine glycosylase [Candidatus Paceibacterota bacterium]